MLLLFHKVLDMDVVRLEVLNLRVPTLLLNTWNEIIISSHRLWDRILTLEFQNRAVDSLWKSIEGS